MTPDVQAFVTSLAQKWTTGEELEFAVQAINAWRSRAPVASEQEQHFKRVNQALDAMDQVDRALSILKEIADKTHMFECLEIAATIKMLAGITKPVASESPKHVCGLSGYNPMIDPPCPGCAEER